MESRTTVVLSQTSGKRNLSTDSREDDYTASKRDASILEISDLNESVFNTVELFKSPVIHNNMNFKQQ